MFGQSEDRIGSNDRQPSPATGLAFVLGCFGLFYGMIAFVDPLL